ncbi:GreA/GreB family elongation factor [Pseudomonas typographi]|uniref:Transcription elongation factor GreAB n=1 Tax=Pseudomonas typographi TaxID=2715964 RepID=A0ABR7YYB8_9PSED|nr:GreA/GreB family elongation factor [Pseudomonas typographi]MBD1550336.1 transcription elongation factor GreAB [Pseudomonas typographi]MBD1598198.1 transcription elongation factor GreAB [Pseudomonas typographi]
MNKPLLIAQIIATLEQDHQVALRSVQTAREAATHEQSKAENKYDTRGLEASYLAHGQARRLEEISQALARYRTWTPAEHDPALGIRVGDLLRLAGPGGQPQWLFLGLDAAGLTLVAEFGPCTVITTQSPLGQALRGQGEGDNVSLALAGGVRAYSILEVY